MIVSELMKGDLEQYLGQNRMLALVRSLVCSLRARVESARRVDAGENENDERFRFGNLVASQIQTADRAPRLENFELARRLEGRFGSSNSENR